MKTNKYIHSINGNTTQGDEDEFDMSFNAQEAALSGQQRTSRPHLQHSANYDQLQEIQSRLFAAPSTTSLPDDENVGATLHDDNSDDGTLHVLGTTPKNPPPHTPVMLQTYESTLREEVARNRQTGSHYTQNIQPDISQNQYRVDKFAEYFINIKGTLLSNMLDADEKVKNASEGYTKYSQYFIRCRKIFEECMTILTSTSQQELSQLYDQLDSDLPDHVTRFSDTLNDISALFQSMVDLRARLVGFCDKHDRRQVEDLHSEIVNLDKQNAIGTKTGPKHRLNVIGRYFTVKNMRDERRSRKNEKKRELASLVANIYDQHLAMGTQIHEYSTAAPREARLFTQFICHFRNYLNNRDRIEFLTTTTKAHELLTWLGDCKNEIVACYRIGCEALKEDDEASANEFFEPPKSRQHQHLKLDSEQRSSGLTSSSTRKPPKRRATKSLGQPSTFKSKYKPTRPIQSRNIRTTYDGEDLSDEAFGGNEERRRSGYFARESITKEVDVEKSRAKIREGFRRQEAALRRFIKYEDYDAGDASSDDPATVLERKSDTEELPPMGFNPLSLGKMQHIAASMLSHEFQQREKGVMTTDDEHSDDAVNKQLDSDDENGRIAREAKKEQYAKVGSEFGHVGFEQEQEYLPGKRSDLEAEILEKSDKAANFVLNGKTFDVEARKYWSIFAQSVDASVYSNTPSDCGSVGDDFNSSLRDEVKENEFLVESDSKQRTDILLQVKFAQLTKNIQVDREAFERVSLKEYLEYVVGRQFCVNNFWYRLNGKLVKMAKLNMTLEAVLAKLKISLVPKQTNIINLEANLRLKGGAQVNDQLKDLLDEEFKQLDKKDYHIEPYVRYQPLPDVKAVCVGMNDTLYVANTQIAEARKNTVVSVMSKAQGTILKEEDRNISVFSTKISQFITIPAVGVVNASVIDGRYIPNLFELGAPNAAAYSAFLPKITSGWCFAQPQSNWSIDFNLSPNMTFFAFNDPTTRALEGHVLRLKPEIAPLSLPIVDKTKFATLLDIKNDTQLKRNILLFQDIHTVTMDDMSARVLASLPSFNPLEPKPNISLTGFFERMMNDYTEMSIILATYRMQHITTNFPAHIAVVRNNVRFYTTNTAINVGNRRWAPGVARNPLYAWYGTDDLEHLIEVNSDPNRIQLPFFNSSITPEEVMILQRYTVGKGFGTPNLVNGTITTADDGATRNFVLSTSVYGYPADWTFDIYLGPNYIENDPRNNQVPFFVNPKKIISLAQKIANVTGTWEQLAHAYYMVVLRCTRKFSTLLYPTQFRLQGSRWRFLTEDAIEAGPTWALPQVQSAALYWRGYCEYVDADTSAAYLPLSLELTDYLYTFLLVGRMHATAFETTRVTYCMTIESVHIWENMTNNQNFAQLVNDTNNRLESAYAYIKQMVTASFSTLNLKVCALDVAMPSLFVKQFGVAPSTRWYSYTYREQALHYSARGGGSYLALDRMHINAQFRNWAGSTVPITDLIHAAGALNYSEPDYQFMPRDDVLPPIDVRQYDMHGRGFSQVQLKTFTSVGYGDNMSAFCNVNFGEYDTQARLWFAANRTVTDIHNGGVTRPSLDGFMVQRHVNVDSYGRQNEAFFSPCPIVNRVGFNGLLCPGQLSSYDPSLAQTRTYTLHTDTQWEGWKFIKTKNSKFGFKFRPLNLWEANAGYIRTLDIVTTPEILTRLKQLGTDLSLSLRKYVDMFNRTYYMDQKYKELNAGKSWFSNHPRDAIYGQKPSEDEEKERDGANQRRESSGGRGGRMIQGASMTTAPSGFERHITTDSQLKNAIRNEAPMFQPDAPRPMKPPMRHTESKSILPVNASTGDDMKSSVPLNIPATSAVEVGGANVAATSTNLLKS